ncbi:hypothetical protein GCM10007275_03550 [Jeotgalicoccus coquinae]|uniref:Uncharacterized protein YpmS n=1 Tax=Jeotgalicoccus coquinae TaxID=709509 RepID=A0A6V7R8R9_9STAP|nr:DUF2140 family protein [Jeotgalicoccus coquinae]MBB6422980.1 uncharacterized protein YpmS [Jeotgalicoccus coquinae]GGE11630.1 hypothetical protein GCM10007275_03550 [Jeotgalicoccus coquinae]CAD2073553.1 hypothetical protein JEOCOQ751_00702 [Jeotgalicoccus coquinae]
MKKNVWMILFFVLLAVNIAVVVIVSSFFNQSYKQTDGNDPAAKPRELEFILTNSTVETLINDNIPYDEFTVNINTAGIDVDIEQTVLGFSINSSISGEPSVNDNSIIIHLTDLNLAGLPLSEDALYTALRKLVELPEGIAMSGSERAIVIDMSLFEQYFGVALQADKIDYENDAWYFSVNNNF